MSISSWTDADTAQVSAIWAEYQARNDLSSRLGQAAGIDPISGRVWFGESAQDIWRQRQAEGLDTPFYCVRVGSDYYVRKGGHR